MVVADADAERQQSQTPDRKEAHAEHETLLVFRTTRNRFDIAHDEHGGTHAYI